MGVLLLDTIVLHSLSDKEMFHEYVKKILIRAAFVSSWMFSLMSISLSSLCAL